MAKILPFLLLSLIFNCPVLLAQTPAIGFVAVSGAPVEVDQGRTKTVFFTDFLALPDGLTDYQVEIVRNPIASTFVGADFFIDNNFKTFTYSAPSSEHTSDSFEWRAVDATDSSVFSNTVTMHIKITGEDADEDTFPNNLDSFPFDPCAYLDSDNDGYPDFYNTGYTEEQCSLVLDAFPHDNSEYRDTDGDGIGNTADTDDDNDGMPDSWETERGFDILDQTDATQDSDGDGHSNLQEYIDGRNPFADDYPPVINVADYTADSESFFTKIDKPLAFDLGDGTVDVELTNYESLYLLSGRHRLIWQASDLHQNTATVDQTVDLYPKAHLGEDVRLAEGNRKNLYFYLNGLSPVYPVTVDFDITGDVDAGDFSLTSDSTLDSINGLSGRVVITESNGKKKNLELLAVSDAISDANETFNLNILAVNGTTNPIGSKKTQTVTFVENSQAPSFYFSMTQDGANTLFLSKSGTTATITPVINFQNAGAVLSFSWSDENGTAITESSVGYTIESGGALSLDVGNFETGEHSVTLRISDTSGGTNNTKTLFFHVLAIGEDIFADNNSNGISDDLEQFGDFGNILPGYRDETLESLIFSPSNVILSKGRYALATGVDYIRIPLERFQNYFEANQLIFSPDSNHTYIDGLFDLNAENIESGASIPFVINLLNPLPDNAVFRVYSGTSWSSFTKASAENIQFAEEENGVCPEPFSTQYRDTLNGGEKCVQITITDGGFNDSDRKTNSKIGLTGYFGSPTGVLTNPQQFVPGNSLIDGQTPIMGLNLLPGADITLDSFEFSLSFENFPSQKSYEFFAYIDSNTNGQVDANESTPAGQATFTSESGSVRVNLTNSLGVNGSQEAKLIFTFRETTSTALLSVQNAPYYASGFGFLFFFFVIGRKKRSLRNVISLLILLTFLSGCQYESAPIGGSQTTNGSVSSSGTSSDPYSLQFTFGSATYSHGSSIPPDFGSETISKKITLSF